MRLLDRLLGWAGAAGLAVVFLVLLALNGLFHPVGMVCLTAIVITAMLL